MYAYSLTTDTFKFNQTIEKGTVVKLSYENYNDVEERDTGKSTYLIKVPEDRDIPNIWNDIHKVAKGIYRFVVRENDVFKPWDYHVSAVIPQVDSPACINPVEQLSITQDKTVIFNFPTPLASQRFIYSDAEADIIVVDTAHGHSKAVLTAVNKIKKLSNKCIYCLSGNEYEHSELDSHISFSSQNKLISFGKKGACINEKSVKAPETEPPATKPVPKPTASPTLKEDITKEPPSETNDALAISVSLAS